MSPLRNGLWGLCVVFWGWGLVFFVGGGVVVGVGGFVVVAF